MGAQAFRVRAASVPVVRGSTPRMSSRWWTLDVDLQFEHGGVLLGTP